MTEMSPAETVFFAALAKVDPAERAAYLDEACGADTELRRCVDRLLAAHPQVGSFLRDDDVAPTSSPGGVGSEIEGRPHRRAAEQPAPRQDHRPVQAPTTDRGRRLRRGIHGRAAAPDPPQGRFEGPEGGHGHAAGGRPLRGRAAGPGPDGARRHCPRPGRRRGPALGDPTSSWSSSRASPSPGTATSTSSRRESGWPCSCPFARPCSTPTRKESSTATSNRPMSWSPLYDGKPVPKVIDFGVAKAPGAAVDRTDPGHGLRQHRRHARVYEPRAGRIQCHGCRYPRRYLQSGRAALRAADRVRRRFPASGSSWRP